MVVLQKHCVQAMLVKGGLVVALYEEAARVGEHARDDNMTTPGRWVFSTCIDSSYPSSVFDLLHCIILLIAVAGARPVCFQPGQLAFQPEQAVLQCSQLLLSSEAGRPVLDRMNGPGGPTARCNQVERVPLVVLGEFDIGREIIAGHCADPLLPKRRRLGAPFQAVLAFGPDGTYLRTYGKPTDFNFPNGVAVDAGGNVYVADSDNGRLVVFDAGGNQVGIVGRGAGAGNLGLPRGIAIDDSGRVYVADLSLNGVQVYHVLAAGETHPQYVGDFGEGGAGDGAFQLPNAVAVDGRARVYVADWRNNRIQVWTY